MKFIKIPLFFLAMSLLTSCQLAKSFTVQSTKNTHSIQANQKLADKILNHSSASFANTISDKSFEAKVKVALLLPMTGKNQELGRVLYNSAIMSLFDNNNRNIELFLFDSKENTRDLERVVKNIIQQNIKIIIGPVFSNQIMAITNLVKQNNLVVISLSNNQQLMNNKGIFLAGFLPEQQIERSVSYAINNGKKNFAAILPNNQFGLTYSNLLREMIKIKGGKLVSEEFYFPSGKDLPAVVTRVVNSYTVPALLAEGGSNNLAKDFVLKESDKIYPQVIFIPEGGKNLSQISQLIKKSNVNERPFELVGSSDWEDISVLNDNNLYGAWFSSPEHYRFQHFEENYYHFYNKFPSRISSIIYDIVTAISQISAMKGKEPEFNDFIAYASISDKNGFEGIDGLFRFLENGLVQRNFAIIQVNKGAFTTLDQGLDKFLKYKKN